jgi:hypothetical protein
MIQEDIQIDQNRTRQDCFPPKNKYKVHKIEKRARKIKHDGQNENTQNFIASKKLKNGKNSQKTNSIETKKGKHMYENER